MPHISQLPIGQAIGNVGGVLAINSVGDLSLNPTTGFVRFNSANITGITEAIAKIVTSSNATGADTSLRIGKTGFAQYSIVFTADGTSYYSNSTTAADTAFLRSGVSKMRISDATLTGSATLEVNNLNSFSGDLFIGAITSVIDFSSNGFKHATITDITNNVAANSLKTATGIVDAAAATAPTAGQVLTATSSTTATWQANSSITWTSLTTTTVSAAVNNGYIAAGGALQTFTLPATASVGDVIKIIGLGAGGWKVAQNASQLVHFGNSVTTTGTGGSIASNNQYDSIELICIVANTTWTAISQSFLTVT